MLLVPGRRLLCRDGSCGLLCRGFRVLVGDLVGFGVVSVSVDSFLGLGGGGGGGFPGVLSGRRSWGWYGWVVGWVTIVS